MPEETTTQPIGQLTPVVNLIERSLNRFKRLFSPLFPWLVISCLGGFMAALANATIPLWQRSSIAVVGLVILFVSYIAEIRIISGVEQEPNDIVSNTRASLKLFFPYIWLAILETFIFISGITLVVPAIIFVVYVVIVPFVFVVENGRGLPALTRSWGYVAGRWWATLWRLMVVVFLVLVVTFILDLILALSFGFSPILVNSMRFWGVVLIQQLIEAFLLAPWVILYLFELYQDLRTTKSVPATADEKTARLWLVIFLILGIILALLFAFGAVTHTAAYGAHQEIFHTFTTGSLVP